MIRYPYFLIAQLIDADTGAHVFSETYDRQLSDVFTIQDEIAASIASDDHRLTACE